MALTVDAHQTLQSVDPEVADLIQRDRTRHSSTLNFT
jgi:hypothetical protein